MITADDFHIFSRSKVTAVDLKNLKCLPGLLAKEVHDSGEVHVGCGKR